MLAFDRVDALLKPISDHYERFQLSVIRDMARRLSRLFAGQKAGLITSAWQLDRLRESGLLYSDIIAELGRLTPYTEAELKRMFEQAGAKSMRFDRAIIETTGQVVRPLSQSPQMMQVLKAEMTKTGGVLFNLTRTTAVRGVQQFVEVSDNAYELVKRGSLSIDSALRYGVRELADQGVQVINYSSGKVERADVALLRNIRTGIGQTTGELTLANAREYETDLVEVSAHSGARNKGVGAMNHESWQGRVYSISGKHPKYDSLVDVTGYGTATGLNGINCRHSFYLFFEGVDRPEYTQEELDRLNNTTVTYQGQEMDLYEATQQQRHFERQIRNWKRRQAAMEAAGLPTDTEKAKIREWQANLRGFIKQTGLERQSFREQVVK